MVYILSNKLREKQIKEIPSVDEFITNLKNKYCNGPKRKLSHTSSELEVMKDWIEDKRKEIQDTQPAPPRVDATLGYEDKEISVNPTFTKYYYQGISSYEAGDYKGSVEFFGRALKINPYHQEAYRYLLKAFYFVKQRNRGY